MISMALQAVAEYVGITGPSALRAPQGTIRDALDFIADHPAEATGVVLVSLFVWRLLTPRH